VIVLGIRICGRSLQFDGSRGWIGGCCVSDGCRPGELGASGAMGGDWGRPSSSHLDDLCLAFSMNLYMFESVVVHMLDLYN
jgi:hypothetical protein